MIRKSVETRDWAHSSEPRNVRAVMRRILEELSAAEPIASLFEDGPVQPPGSGSRHHARYFHLKYGYSNFVILQMIETISNVLIRAYSNLRSHSFVYVFVLYL